MSRRRHAEQPVRQCPSCAELFSCGRDAPGGCWCAQLEPLGEDTLRQLAVLGERCLCPRCLAEQIAKAS